MKTIDYWTAAWCTPCKALKPKVQALCDKNDWTLIEHDFDAPANHQTALTLGILSVPTLYLRHNDRVRILTGQTATLMNVKKEMAE